MRNRNLSSFEYFNTAVAIRNDVTRLVTSRDVPKSYRFILAVPMAETARSLVFNLVKADAFYPNTARNVEERKRYMTLALAGRHRRQGQGARRAQGPERKGTTEADERAAIMAAYGRAAKNAKRAGRKSA